MIYLKPLQQAYIQVGSYKLQKKYRKGHTYVQGAEMVVGDVDPATLQNLPEYFVNGWAQFMYPVPEPEKPNNADMWDSGAYGVGIPVIDTEFLNIPKFKKIQLFYFHTTSVNNETREVVQFEPEAFIPYVDEDGETVTAADFIEILSTTYWESEREYYDWLNKIGALRGFNRNGRAYPPGITKSAVSELSSLKGRVEVSTGVFEDVTILVTPMYIQNQLPLFDMVYFANDTLATEDGKSGVKESLYSGRMLRWYGGFQSEYRVGINFSDHSKGGVNIPTGSNLDGSDRPRIEDQIVIDGETYLNSNAYNITRRLN